jgi:hypothetical protein
MSLEKCPFATCACPFSRCVAHPSFTHATKAKPRSRHQKTPPLKRREAERRETRVEKDRIIKRCGAHPFSSPPDGRTEVASDLMERARSPFGAPPRHFAGFHPGSAQAALPGTTGCKREDPLRHQCSEHLAVRHVPDGTMPKPPVSAVYRCARREPLPLRLKEYPRERRPSRAG